MRRRMSEIPLGSAADAPQSEPPHKPLLPPFLLRQVPPLTQRQWRVFGISTTAGFFDNYDLALLSLALKQIQHGLGIAEAHLGNMLSAIRLGYLTSLLISPLADVFGRRRLLLYTIIGYTVFTALSAVAPRERDLYRHAVHGARLFRRRGDRLARDPRRRGRRGGTWMGYRS